MTALNESMRFTAVGAKSTHMTTENQNQPTVSEKSLLETLDEIEQRAIVATEGPWSVQEEVAIDYRPCQIYGASGGSQVAWLTGGGRKRAIGKPEERANAAFIAAARSDLPKLVKALRRQQEIINSIFASRPSAQSFYEEQLTQLLREPADSVEEMK